jgi:hypothetical protein
MEQQLRAIKYKPESYLKEVRLRAQHSGYDPSQLKFATDGIHKLSILTPEGKTVSFGRVGYGDFLVWSFLEKRGDAERGYARNKQMTFQKSHRKLPGAWRTDKYSPNNLALRILW